jgi:predicted metal-binding protein
MPHKNIRNKLDFEINILSEDKKSTMISSLKYNSFTIDITGTLIEDKNVRNWCRLPYPGHPNGCPNWNQRDECPPKVSLVSDRFDLLKDHWFIVVEFNLAQHRKEMLEKHPNWSLKQANCCLYWQGGVRKQLKDLCKLMQEHNNQLIYTLIPEAMGVNVFKTMQKHGIILKRNPSDTLYKIALLGYPLMKESGK